MAPIFLALLGVLLNLGKKIDAQQKLAKSGNVPFTITGYLQSDWFSILASIVAVILVAMQSGSIEAALPEKYKGWGWVLHLTAGYMGSDLLIYALGKGRTAALKVIDRKTNLADGVDGNSGK